MDIPGYKLMAVTKHADGLSFDAHRIVGKRKLVRGPIKPTYEEAIQGLKEKCKCT